MLREKIVFGPIFSRRLGSSLGINLLPEEGKLCNFDCVYCECGWNRDGRGDIRIPSAEDLRKALELKLEECKASVIGIDSITFSGDGEPTLNPQFPEMVDVTIELRDRYYPKSVISVLTNATRICRPEVRKALMKVDNAILKLDASSDRMVEMINQPACDYSVRDIVEDMKLFDGQFIMQTMFLRFPGFDSLEPENLKNWMDIVREVKPREVMAYTLDRPAPAEGLEKVHPDEMKRALQPLIDEGFKVQIKG